MAFVFVLCSRRRLHSGAPRESRGKITKAPIMTQGAERAPRELQEDQPAPEGNGSAPNIHNRQQQPQPAGARHAN
jgi:hypothetical protein